MSGDIVIRAEALGKKYLIEHQAQRERYTALRDVIGSRIGGIGRHAANLFRTRTAVPRNSSEEFWALKDLHFEIRQGEVVGIIGRNGAGKTTLLKILSRITEPSAGRAEIKGRVASLLEVGTGFHPELTGRENIYLNGAILGMDRAEIRRKFDEIVAFAEVEKFLDTPVKRYSSGMYVRLAFAVAAHVEPEILIVDEVLAVGDAEFQKKCLGRMGEVAKDRRTVLFVSHDMRKITSLCCTGILLDAGKIEAQGSIGEVAAAYLEQRDSREGVADLTNRGDRSGNGDARVKTVELLKSGTRTATFAFGDSLTQRITVDVQRRIGASMLAIVITSSDGVAVHELWNVNEGCPWVAESGCYRFEVTIPRLCIYPGTYSVDLWLGDNYSGRIDYITEAVKFNVIQTPESKLRPLDRANGLVFQQSQWSYEKLQ
jgi:lipopolysaccharide transport system ATP-binding protein